MNTTNYHHPATNRDCPVAGELHYKWMSVSPLLNDVRPIHIALRIRESRRGYEYQKALWNYKDHIAKCDICREGLDDRKEVRKVRADVIAG